MRSSLATTFLLPVRDDKDLTVCQARLTGLLDTFRRIGVRPDSIQVSGGMLSIGLPTHRVWVWFAIGLQFAGRRGEAWLQRGLPSS